MFHFYGNCFVFTLPLFTMNESVSTRVWMWDCLYSLIQFFFCQLFSFVVYILQIAQILPLPRDKCDSLEIKTFWVLEVAVLLRVLTRWFVYDPPLSPPSSAKCKKDPQITFFPSYGFAQAKTPFIPICTSICSLRFSRKQFASLLFHAQSRLLKRSLRYLPGRLTRGAGIC